MKKTHHVTLPTIIPSEMAKTLSKSFSSPVPSLPLCQNPKLKPGFGSSNYWWWPGWDMASPHVTLGGILVPLPLVLVVDGDLVEQAAASFLLVP